MSQQFAACPSKQNNHFSYIEREIKLCNKKLPIWQNDIFVQMNKYFWNDILEKGNTF